MSLVERIRAALLLFGGGLVVGAMLLPIPLIHLVGVFAALTGIFLAISRLRRKFVVAAAGGVCPRCGHEGRFFSGLGRSKFDFPVTASCGSCGIGLTLFQS